MNFKTRNFIISSILILVAITFVILVKNVDVKAIGPNGSEVGFASVNQFVFERIGVNMIWYHITDWLGILPIAMAVVYAFIGLIQFIKRRSLFKVNKEILILGIFYIVVIGLYIFFEKVVINYRPVLMDGYLEASFPSSHTLITICICGSSIIISKSIFNARLAKYLDIISIILAIFTVIGRLISGVHWFTDIIGGILISVSLLMVFYTLLKLPSKKMKNDKENK